ncbi:hypothetical protein GLOIN_2v1849309 [Rhizophagus irregularis DAOM 181602=DAOM 197198]|nr:hypothetical protein GLOIN_2v1849309 [Rhizophagus irregularis DAOM 181602=DAOM 197198]
MTSPSAVYPLIHTLLTLRTVVACTIHKILYNPDSGDSDHSSSEMVVTLPMVTMTGILTPSFHVYYLKQLNQLPCSIKIDVWRRLTSRKHPLSMEQASSIHPEVEDLLNKAVGNYIKQKEPGIGKKIEELLELQEQYKSREVAMTRSLEESGEKVVQLSDSVAFFKSIIPDTKKAITSAEKSIDVLENKCRHLEDIISAKDRKIVSLVDQILSNMKHSDITIEPKIYSSTYERNLWAKRHSESEHDLETRKKYTFRP